jgi:putative ABC transport system permease protein
MLLKYPGFTAMVIVVLALGIGATTAIFSLVNGVLLKPLPGVQRPERLVSVYTSDYSSGPYGGSSYPDFVDFRDQADAFSGLAASENAVANLNAGDQSERLHGQAVTANYFLRPRCHTGRRPHVGAGGRSVGRPPGRRH